MNGIVNKLLLAGDKFMPEMHLKQPGFTYSACRTFTKNKEKINKIKETGDSGYIYENELDKACVQHDMAYGDFMIWLMKHLILLRIRNMMDINVGFRRWFINFLIKKLLVEQLKMKLFLTKN